VTGADRFDQAGDVRAEDAVDLERLREYLGPRLSGLAGPLELRQFPSGASNRTYLLRNGDREWVLRMPPLGTKAATAHDMGREFRVLGRLHPVFPLCPRPLLACDDETILGTPFYLMERLRGLILRRDLPPGFTYSSEEARQLCENLVAAQARLHAIDWQIAGLGDVGHPNGYVERQVRGWNERYRRARTADGPDGESVMSWLEANRPPDNPRPVVVHNDYRLDNVVLDPDDAVTIRGVLDWEMATIGDPLMDLGCSLAYWVEAGDPPELERLRLQPSHLPGMLTRREMVELYAERSGREVGDSSFYEIFGLFRLAVIAQQIYYRYARGETASRRAAALGGFVPVLVAAAAARIERSR
jgi:aminoglycoside phosphotransferase (APT) family kinase protein